MHSVGAPARNPERPGCGSFRRSPAVAGIHAARAVATCRPAKGPGRSGAARPVSRETGRANDCSRAERTLSGRQVLKGRESGASSISGHGPRVPGPPTGRSGEREGASFPDQPAVPENVAGCHLDVPPDRGRRGGLPPPNASAGGTANANHPRPQGGCRERPGRRVSAALGTSARCRVSRETEGDWPHAGGFSPHSLQPGPDPRPDPRGPGRRLLGLSGGLPAPPLRPLLGPEHESSGKFRGATRSLPAGWFVGGMASSEAPRGTVSTARKLSTAVFHRPLPFHVKQRSESRADLWMTGCVGDLICLWTTSWTGDRRRKSGRDRRRRLG